MIEQWVIEVQMESYIAEPYWPQRDDVIQIEKKSGMNFARTDEKRAATLLAYLEQQGMTRADYDALVVLAARPWYRTGEREGEIVIPRHQVSGALVQATKLSPSSIIKTSYADSLRTLLRLDDWKTGKMQRDELFRRYVKNDSNQRRLSESEVIKDFTAKGTLGFDRDVLRPETVKALLRYMLSMVGVGSCRKMGYGRGELKSFTEQSE